MVNKLMVWLVFVNSSSTLAGKEKESQQSKPGWEICRARRELRLLQWVAPWVGLGWYNILQLLKGWYRSCCLASGVKFVLFPLWVSVWFPSGARLTPRWVSSALQATQLGMRDGVGKRLFLGLQSRLKWEVVQRRREKQPDESRAGC